MKSSPGGGSLTPFTLGPSARRGAPKGPLPRSRSSSIVERWVGARGFHLLSSLGLVIQGNAWGSLKSSINLREFATCYIYAAKSNFCYEASNMVLMSVKNKLS